MNKQCTITVLLLKAFFVLFTLSFITSCESNRFDVDISGKDIKFTAERFDRDFTKFKNENYSEVNAYLKNKYPTFHPLYLTNIMALGHPKDPATEKQINLFLNNSDIASLYDSVLNAFPEIDYIEQDLKKAFTYYHYWFPEKHIPKVVTFMGAFNYTVAVSDSVLGIGLENYLGQDFSLYKEVGLPLYKIKKMEPEYLVYDAMRGWLLSEFSDPDKQDFLLASILEFGKALYLMDAMFPNRPDYLKIGFQEKELQWCLENEHHIWQSMMNSDMLFSRDKNALKKYTGEAPFTPGMPEESPGRVGNWVGWQIIKSFAKNNPDMTPQQIIELTDYKSILSKSKYKPKK